MDGERDAEEEEVAEAEAASTAAGCCPGGGCVGWRRLAPAGRPDGAAAAAIIISLAYASASFSWRRASCAAVVIASWACS